MAKQQKTDSLILQNGKTMKTFTSKLFPIILAFSFTSFVGCTSTCTISPSDSPNTIDKAKAENKDSEDENDFIPGTETVFDILSEGTDNNIDKIPGEPKRKPDVHFVPTPDPVIKKMLDVANVTKDDLVYDLGCGDGRILIMAAKKYGARAVGYDIDPAMVQKARANARKAGVQHLVTIKEADIFQLDLSPATVITMYLLPKLNVKLIPQLEKLKDGVRIVSHDFNMQGIRHKELHAIMGEENRELNRDHHVYFWTTPLDKADSEKED